MSGHLSTLQNSLSVLLVLGLVIVFTLHAWNSVSFVMHSPPDASTAPSSIAKRDHSSVIKTILEANLFKSAETKTYGDPGAVLASSLKLLGTFAGANGTPSYALITQPGQKERTYQIGDQIGGDIQVEGIYPDHVILSKGLSKVTLNLKYPQ